MSSGSGWSQESIGAVNIVIGFERSIVWSLAGLKSVFDQFVDKSIPLLATFWELLATFGATFFDYVVRFFSLWRQKDSLFGVPETNRFATEKVHLSQG